MAGDVNRQITLGSRPVNYPRESDFALLETPIPDPGEGQVLVQTLWLSLDPYMRGRMRASHAYATPMELGQVIVGGVVGRIIRSRTPAFSVGGDRRRVPGLAGVRGLRREQLEAGGLGAWTPLNRFGSPGYAGDDRLLRLLGSRTAT